MSNRLYTSFGFSGNPYESSPLPPTAEGAELFVGREELGAKFATEIDCDRGCVTVLSGDIGVGKTSFFNVQQYLLSSGEAAFGPRLIPAFDLTTMDQGDTPVALARRLAHNTAGNVKQYCLRKRVPFPRTVTELTQWLSHDKAVDGLEVGLTLGGVGANVAVSYHLPPVSDASMENFRDAFRMLGRVAKDELSADGIAVVLDNAESLHNDELCSLLMSFRDTLFQSEFVWWFVIGQSGLYSLLDAADKRISQRIQGNGVEVAPLTSDELHALVRRRVEHFSARPGAVSPISVDVHNKLYNASRGEVRFVLKTSDTLVRRVMSRFRRLAQDRARAYTEQNAKLFRERGVSDMGSARERIEETLMAVVKEALVDGQLVSSFIMSELTDLTRESIGAHQFSAKELWVLGQIGSRTEARSRDFADFKLKSAQDFSANYLSKMFRLNLLHRRQAGRAVYYSLRGFAALGFEMGVLEPPQT